MHIGYDAKRLFCNYRGLGNYSRNLIAILQQYYPNNRYYLFTPRVAIDFSVGSDTQIIQPQGIYKLLPSSVWRTMGIPKKIAYYKNDIFHGLSQELPWGIEKLKVKKIITFHDAIFVRYPNLYHASYRAIFSAKNKRSCAIADRIVAISVQSKNDAIEFFGAEPSKIDIVYQGCNNIFRIKASVEQKKAVSIIYHLPSNFLLFVGAIEPRKNIASILQALYQHKIDIPLVIVGHESNYKATLLQLAVSLGISSQLHFLHQVETAHLPIIYQLATIFVYPSLFEGFGIPILEALCSETPVITSTGSCFEETGGKHSVYVEPLDADALGEAITIVLANNELQKKMQTEGLLHAAMFTDDKIAQNMMKVYKSVLQE